ncbi:MAG: hypothetical protein EVA65_15750 [Oceanococcus sp.]|nr:MAG: hypothetical protein EVA65_15750 [Oceanococcus sp.]
MSAPKTGEFYAHAQHLLDNGYPPLPIKVGQKRPALKNWSSLEITARGIARLRENGCRPCAVGTRTGADLVATDVDCLNEDVSAELRRWIYKRFGVLPTRYGLKPKFLIPFRWRGVTYKRASSSYIDVYGDKCRVEILGLGQQFVTFGTHPDTGNPYEWQNGSPLDTPARDLPLLDEQDVREMFAEFDRICRKHGLTLSSKAIDNNLSVDGDEDLLRGVVNQVGVSFESAREYLAKIDNSGEAFEIEYDDWFNLIAGIHHEFEGSEDGFELADEFSANSPKYDFRHTRDVWESLEVDRAIGAVRTFRTVIDWNKHRSLSDQLGAAPDIVESDDFDLDAIEEAIDDSADRQETESIDKPKGPTIVGTKAFGFVQPHESILHMSSVRWTVKHYLEKDALCFVVGPPDSYKSFVALDWAMSVATGRQWNGKTVEQGPVAYIAGEGHSGVAKRIAAWARHNDAEDELMAGLIPIYVSQKSAFFCDLDGARAASRAIDRIMIREERKPRLVVIDTLARNYGGDENDTRDMNAFIEHVEEAIRRRYNCTVVVVHHTGRADNSRARGSSVIEGAASMLYICSRPDGTSEIANLRCDKMKEYAKPPEMWLDGTEVDVTDMAAQRPEDGERITSLVFDEGTAPIAAPPEPPTPTDAEQRVLDLIDEHCDGLGEISVKDLTGHMAASKHYQDRKTASSYLAKMRKRELIKYCGNKQTHLRAVDWGLE